MQIGPYRVLRVLARGGMGEVCLATLERAGGFRKQVALKRALPEFAADPDFVAMFQREARIAAALNHRNIVQVFDFDHHADQAWIAMEYVRGVNLKAVLDAARPPLGLAIDIGLSCARGLDYVHRASDASGRPLHLVHQDVSPANVLLSYEGDVKLSDFGVAWQRDGIRRGLQGKLGYLSPEAVRGARLDARADQFALGAVLYEMFAGQRAFWAEDGTEAILDRVRGAAPLLPLAEAAPDLPAGIRAVVERALALDPADRFADVGALAEALEAAAGGIDRSLALGGWLSAHFREPEALASEPPIEVTAAAVAPIVSVDVTAPPIAPIVAAPVAEPTPPPDLSEPSAPIEADRSAPPPAGGRWIGWALVGLLVGGGALAAWLWPDPPPLAPDAAVDARVPDARVPDAQVPDVQVPDARVLDAAPPSRDAAPPPDAALETAAPQAPKTRPRAPRTRAPQTRPPQAPETRAPATAAPPTAPPTAPPSAPPTAEPPIGPPPAVGPRVRLKTAGAQLSGGQLGGDGWHTLDPSGAMVRFAGAGPEIVLRLRPQAGRFVATVTSNPFGPLTVDGRALGSTPAAAVPLSAGRHVIEVGASRLVVEVGF